MLWSMGWGKGRKGLVSQSLIKGRKNEQKLSFLGSLPSFFPPLLPQAVSQPTMTGRTHIWRSPNISVKEEIKTALMHRLSLV